MSPLKADVLINECNNTLSISVGKRDVGLSRDLNIYLASKVEGVRPSIVSKYRASWIHLSYAVVRYSDGELVGGCHSLAECQAVALSDYIQQSGLELVSGESTQEV